MNASRVLPPLSAGASERYLTAFAGAATTSDAPRPRVITGKAPESTGALEFCIRDLHGSSPRSHTLDVMSVRKVLVFHPLTLGTLSFLFCFLGPLRVAISDTHGGARFPNLASEPVVYEGVDVFIAKGPHVRTARVEKFLRPEGAQRIPQHLLDERDVMSK